MLTSHSNVFLLPIVTVVWYTGTHTDITAKNFFILYLGWRSGWEVWWRWCRADGWLAGTAPRRAAFKFRPTSRHRCQGWSSTLIITARWLFCTYFFLLLFLAKEMNGTYRALNLQSQYVDQPKHHPTLIWSVEAPSTCAARWPPVRWTGTCSTRRRRRRARWTWSHTDQSSHTSSHR